MEAQGSQDSKLMPEHVCMPPLHLHAAVLFIDRKLNLTLCNTLSQQLLNTAQPLGQVVPLGHCLSVETEEFQIMSDVAVRGRELQNFVMRWELDGRVRHVLVDSFPGQNTDTEAVGIYILMKDIGNFSWVDQKVQRTEKLSAMSKMAAGIAHEIRNPLTTVKGFMQMLENRFAQTDMEVERQYADVMLTEMNRIESLVSELLLLSAPHTVHKQVWPISKLIVDVYVGVKAQAALGGVAVSYEVTDDLDVEGDAELLQIALCNLARNGIEAMEQGGSLRIAVGRVKKCVQIDVSDTGPGIPYYLIDKIYDVFFTTKDKSIGLGLPIAQKVVEAHHGEIRVASKGFGTTFSVLLPLRTRVT